MIKNRAAFSDIFAAAIGRQCPCRPPRRSGRNARLRAHGAIVPLEQLVNDARQRYRGIWWKPELKKATTGIL